ncbi:DUF4255 domain-containing protein [Pedobacter sp. ASV28]|uniref:DUF4255 domain-containing protein n=1 Tax=Pedobacter sp. ASV28 TaxID=2795123 RepID=UPI0018ED1C59|nr:DUF4255 domain-containing protein [Pedobacter sp. ASV28]
MIYRTLQLLTEQLNEYLKLSFNLREDMVFLSPVKDDHKVFPANRVSVMLVGLGRETAGGINFPQATISGQHTKRMSPSWQLHINVLLSVVFQDKQYEESLQLLSVILSFIQKSPVLRSPDRSNEFAIEPVNLSIQEMANLWGICGGGYFPSMMFRLRFVTIDMQDIQEILPIFSHSDLNMGIQNPKPSM